MKVKTMKEVPPTKMPKKIQLQSREISATVLPSIIGLSAVLGAILVVSSIILVTEVTPRLDKCHDPLNEAMLDGCHPLYINLVVGGVGILLGIFQLTIFTVSLYKRMLCTPHSIFVAHFVTFVTSLILFSVTMVCDSTVYIYSLRMRNSAVNSRFLFFYAITGITWIFSLIVLVLTNQCTMRRRRSEESS